MAKLLYLLTEDWFFCSHFIDRAVAMRKAGYDVVIATRISHHADAIYAAGLRARHIDLRRRSLAPWRELATLMSICRIYQSETPDIVHHVALKPVLYGTLVARRCGVRHIVNAPIGMGYVFTSDRWLARLLRPCVNLAMRLLLNPPGSRVIFENSDDMQSLIAQRMVRQDRAVLIRGAGVDLARFHPTPEPEGTPVVTLVARMLWDKGVGEFVEAARMLKASGVQARFLLVGDPDEENPASIRRSQLLDWQEEGTIEWLGRRDDIPAILAMSHIACLPSYREGLPKSLLEALAAGRPVVATDVPGCREAVTDGDNGLVVPARDPVALATALKTLIEDKAIRQRFGARGRSRAEAEFGTEHVVAATRRVYDNLLKSASPQARPEALPSRKAG
ncbi:MAG: glycosyltransferase family 4 protein [Pseudomonadota bacterium]|nr:glycosyltransferase family 4 protein [Pseudomonadota bacterium]